MKPGIQSRLQVLDEFTYIRSFPAHRPSMRGSIKFISDRSISRHSTALVPTNKPTTANVEKKNIYKNLHPTHANSPPQSCTTVAAQNTVERAQSSLLCSGRQPSLSRCCQMEEIRHCIWQQIPDKLSYGYTPFCIWTTTYFCYYLASLFFIPG